jgi:ATP-dependent DNA helicase RecQ
MLKGRKDSKIVKGKYYENEYYGIFASFKGNEVSNVLDYLIEEGIILKELKSNNTFVYTNKTVNDLYKYYYNFIEYISDNSINIIEKEDENLFRKLKDARYGLAMKENLSPHNVCSDKVLREICIKKPKDTEEMDAIYGIGEYFINNYSEAFLKVIVENI